MVLNVERLAWVLLALWAVLTRLIVLGARPLSSSEARNALFEYDFTGKTAHAAAVGFHPISGGWVHLLEAGLFAAIGANDFSARLVFALSGLLIVAMAASMRSSIGRAGAIALGVMLTISPSVTYFSRSGSMVTPAVAMTLIAIALFMDLIDQPGQRRALRLGLVLGLMVAAGLAGAINALAFSASLALLGLWLLVSKRNAYLGIRVWMDRYIGLAIAVLVATVAVIALSEAILPDVIHNIRAASNQYPREVPGFAAGFAFYSSPLALYEFLIVILAITGALLTLAFRVRSRFAWWCVIWAVVSASMYLWMPLRASAITMVMVVPAAFVGAIAIEHLHHTNAWRYVRFPIAVLGLLTIYVQVLSNFVYFAPDASEAQWSSHANLAWRDGATTIQAYDRCHEITRQLAATSASAYFRGPDSSSLPALRWYLRSLPVARNADAAAVVVDAGSSENAPPDSDEGVKYELDAAESWQPALGDLDTGRAIRYLLTAQTWKPMTTVAARISVRFTGASSPTVIMTPGSSQ